MPAMVLIWPASAWAMESSLDAACLSRATNVLASMSCADLESWFMVSFSACVASEWEFSPSSRSFLLSCSERLSEAESRNCFWAIFMGPSGMGLSMEIPFMNSFMPAGSIWELREASLNRLSERLSKSPNSRLLACSSSARACRRSWDSASFNLPLSIPFSRFASSAMASMRRIMPSSSLVMRSSSLRIIWACSDLERTKIIMGSE